MSLPGKVGQEEPAASAAMKPPPNKLSPAVPLRLKPESGLLPAGTFLSKPSKSESSRPESPSATGSEKEPSRRGKPGVAASSPVLKGHRMALAMAVPRSGPAESGGRKPRT
jgi:hypothetical protein